MAGSGYRTPKFNSEIKAIRIYPDKEIDGDIEVGFYVAKDDVFRWLGPSARHDHYDVTRKGETTILKVPKNVFPQ
jgi:hypothetical protein